MNGYRVCALITCHNRRAKTLQCLHALFGNSLPEEIYLHIILVDDGSSDGTSEAVTREFSQVEILRGDGNLYWNRGMHKAFAAALSTGFDAYLWLNDDTILYPDAIVRLLETASALASRIGNPCVVVGSTEDDSGRLTYGGGVAVSRLRRFKYRKVWDALYPVECEAMNGNCVLIPGGAALVVGNIDPAYEHAMGDMDYSLRAREAGVRVFVAPGFIGKCDNNLAANTYQDMALPFAKRWKLMVGPKGLPPSSWCRFTRRHGGMLWPIYFVWPYLRQLGKL